MTELEKKFYQSNFEIEFERERTQLRGLISEVGITRIFAPAKPPEFITKALGLTVMVHIGALTLKGVFTQQYVEYGSYYEIRFLDLKEPHVNFLRQRIAEEGVSPGWSRKFPRIPVNSQEETDLPVANLCLIRFAGQEIFVSVVNFTLGGLRVETFGDSLNEVRVGARLQFDLLTNTGEVMANLAGQVKNISTHERQTDVGKVITRSFGIKLVDMTSMNERKYRELIKSYCFALMKKFKETGE